MIEIRQAGSDKVLLTVPADTLVGADLHGQRLRGADFSGLSAEGANLWGADLWRSDCHGADFRDANLGRTALREVNLRGADLRGANLSSADLRWAHLEGADLSGANLRGSDLRGTSLRGANLRGADLRGAEFRDADFGDGGRTSAFDTRSTHWPRGRRPATVHRGPDIDLGLSTAPPPEGERGVSFPEPKEPECRGRLRIFLGAAPGVGKTYAMLAEARDLREHGVDVVGAVIQTHGRAETEALLEGLEVLPRQRLDYHGTTLQEMDLDALLARRPQLALVDELAHHNAPGSRHEKRWLDVEELLAAGISVWTTVNVQHLESLNDAVAQITGVRVRETVPDRLFERADEIEVIDLAPADLLRRLDEGKVYVPDTAQIAVRKFFRPGNLAALRELALRHAAQRVGDQVRNYMQAHAIEGPWPTHE
ncbi:MAG: pentapeptide repeat-containing protein, partial [Armatimonadetes bacterium]|nr:pentapeptide repeat-containing protein [Armatimonadota bacterium]